MGVKQPCRISKGGGIQRRDALAMQMLMKACTLTLPRN